MFAYGLLFVFVCCCYVFIDCFVGLVDAVLLIDWSLLFVFICFVCLLFGFFVGC